MPSRSTNTRTVSTKNKSVRSDKNNNKNVDVVRRVCFTGQRPRGKKDDSYTVPEFLALMAKEWPNATKTNKTLEDWIRYSGAILMNESKCKALTKCNKKIGSAFKIADKEAVGLDSCIKRNCKPDYDLRRAAMAQYPPIQKAQSDPFDSQMVTARMRDQIVLCQGARAQAADNALGKVSKKCGKLVPV